MDIDKLVGERLTADNDFQSRIASLTDAEKATETEKRRKEILADEITKRDTIARDQKTRAEKAEQERDALKNDPRLQDPAAKSDELTPADVLTFTNAGITHPDDIKTVQQAAKALGLDYVGALANPIVKGQLASEKDKRDAAAAADKGQGGRGGAEGENDAQFIARLNSGYVPAAGSADAEREWKLRRQQGSSFGAGRR